MAADSVEGKNVRCVLISEAAIRASRTVCTRHIYCAPESRSRSGSPIRAIRLQDARKRRDTGCLARGYDRDVPDLDLDEEDHKILTCLRANARESAEDIGKQVHLAGGTVRRRITRLEKLGVITGYTVALNHDLLGSSMEAYIQLSFAGTADVHAILEGVMDRPEVREAMTMAGGPDALLRVRVGDQMHLRQVVADLRTTVESLERTQTMIVLGRYWHGAKRLAND